LTKTADDFNKVKKTSLNAYLGEYINEAFRYAVTYGVGATESAAMKTATDSTDKLT